MFSVLDLPIPSAMLRESGRPPRPGSMEGTPFSQVGRATKHPEKKRHLVIIKLFWAPFKSGVSELPALVVLDLGSA